MPSPAIYAGKYTKLLTSDGLKFRDDVRIVVGTADPNVVPIDAEKGSIYLRYGAGPVGLYIKQDNGLSTNFNNAGGTPTYANFASLPASAPTGATALTTDTLILYVFNGATWIAESTPGTDLTSLNADATTAQTLSTGTSGTDFAIVDNGTGDHKFNLPVASATKTGKISSADWSTFNGKQDLIPYTTENVANKSTDGTFSSNSDTLYPSQKAAKTYADTKEPLLGFTPENVANKDTDTLLATNSDTKYPSQKAVKSYIDTGLSGKQNTLGFTPENVANKGVASGYAELDASAKLPVSRLPVSTLQYKGTWAASTNTPTLANGVGTAGFFYIASDAGTVNFGAGNFTFEAGDWVLYDGSVWQQSHNGNNVDSVDGLTGVVVLTKGNLSAPGTDGISVTGGTNAVWGSGASISQHVADVSHSGYLSATDWGTFNSKQAALGFTAENVANKSTDGTFASNSDTLYPSQKAVKTYADTKQSALGFTPENVANKSTDGTFAANSDTLYPSQKAVKTYADTKQAALGFTPAHSGANSDITSLTGLTTALSIGQGGTGQTTKAAAFDALSPLTTSGDILYGGTSGTGTRLAKGTDGQYLKLVAGLPTWAAGGGGGSSPTQYEAGNSGASKTIDFTNGTTQRVILTANCTLTLTNPVTGAEHFLIMEEGGSGNYTMTWPPEVRWPGGTNPPSIAYGSSHYVRLYWNGSVYLATYTSHITGIWPFGSLGDLTILNGQSVTITNGQMKDYNNLTINAGGKLILSGDGWGFVGVAGNLVINGTIEAKTGTAWGATYNSNEPDVSGSLVGPSISYSIPSPSGGNGGGDHGNGGGGTAYGNGGGGAGAGGPGLGASFGAGGGGSNYPYDGSGAGGGVPNSNGAGGAGGHGYDQGEGGGGGARGSVGAGLYIKVKGNISGSGSILLNGSKGGNGGPAGDGDYVGASGGGGGAGGSGGKLIMKYHGTNTFPGANINVTAGTFGTGGALSVGGDNDPGSDGGSGTAGSAGSSSVTSY